MKALAWFAVSLVFLIAVACGLIQSRTVSASQIGSGRAIVAAAADFPVRSRAHQDPDKGVDLYGNEVDDAIATYTLDPTGGSYEVHSPQTELPRLASPKS